MRAKNEWGDEEHYLEGQLEKAAYTDHNLIS